MGAGRILELHERLALERGAGTEQLHERSLLWLHAGTRILRQDLLHLAARPAPAADLDERLRRRSSSSSPTSATAAADFTNGTTGPPLYGHLRLHLHLGQPELALAQRRRQHAQQLPHHARSTSLAEAASSPRRIRNTSRSCGSTRGTTWSTTWAQHPATGGCASSARATTPSSSTPPGR